MQQRLQSAEREYNSLIANYAIYEALATNRIVKIFKNQRGNLMDFLLSSNDFNDFLDRIYFQKVIVKQDQRQLENLRQSAIRVNQLKLQIDREKQYLAQTINSIDKEKQSISKAISQNENMIHKLKTDRKAYEKAERGKMILDNTPNINDIISNLTPDDINMLKGVASSILGEGAPENTQSTKQNFNNNQNNNQNALQSLNSLGLDSLDFNMIMKAKSIFDKMNNTPNKNVDLIMALKPHLRPETQNKADQAMKIIKLFEVLPLLRELF